MWGSEIVLLPLSEQDRAVWAPSMALTPFSCIHIAHLSVVPS